MNKVELGSNTAKNGFKNENFVVNTFNNWQNDTLAQSWLKAMKYNLRDIQSVKAQKIKGGFKADVQVVILVQIKLQNLQDVQNIQAKLVSNPQGFNQVDKRWLKNYNELWNFPDELLEILQYFTGEKSPKIKTLKIKEECF